MDDHEKDLTVTEAQKRSVFELQDWLQANAGDSGPRKCSPVGDGRWVSLWQIWGHGNQATAHRRNIAKAWDADGLLAYEIAFMCGAAKLVPLEKIRDAEREFYLSDPSLSASVRDMRRTVCVPVPSHPKL